MQENLSTRLKYFREKNDYTQSDLAKAIHVSPQAVSNWENQKALPSIDNIVLLSKLYGISVDELLGVDSQETAIILEDESPAKNASLLLNQTPHAMLEMLCLAVILILSCQITFVGIISAIVVFFWVKKNRKNYKIIYFLCFICLLISMYNTYNFIEHILGWGFPTIEAI